MKSQAVFENLQTLSLDHSFLELYSSLTQLPVLEISRKLMCI